MDLASASGILSSETGEKRKPEDPSLSLLLLPDGNSAVVDCAPPPALASASLFADGVPDPLMPAAAAPPCPPRNLSLMEEKLCVALPWLLVSRSLPHGSHNDDVSTPLVLDFRGAHLGYPSLP